MFELRAKNEFPDPDSKIPWANVMLAGILCFFICAIAILLYLETYSFLMLVGSFARIKHGRVSVKSEMVRSFIAIICGK